LTPAVDNTTPDNLHWWQYHCHLIWLLTKLIGVSIIPNISTF